MPDLRQALRDFVTTSNSGKYSDEASLLSKFPELQGYSVDALRSFVTTSNSGKYATEDELLSKFPEFGIGATEIKKKEVVLPPSPNPNATDLPLGIGSLEFAKPTKPAQEGPTEKLAVGSMGITGLERTKEYKPEDGQGFLLNIVSSLDKGFYNLPGEAVKGVGTLLEGVTGKGFVSDALNKFGSSYLKAIEELTPQDESFKGSLSDQFGQAFGQVASMVLTSGASQAVKTTTALSAAKAAITSQAAPKAVTIGGAVKKLASELLDPAAVSMGLAMGQGEFERAKQAGATDEQAFEAFYKNAAVGSVLERIPVMQFLKRFNKASAGGVVNYLKTKAIGGLTGGTEEMITEVLQQLYANQTAQDIYNINQDLFEGVGESGGIGFGVGFLLNAMGANAKLLRKQGKNDEADVIENQMTQFKNAPKPPADPPPTYSVSGIKITDPIVINDIIDNMEGTDLAKSNIEITNDPELNDRLQNKIVTSSIKEQVRQGNPELNEPSLNAITELEKELKKLEGNTTQTGKDKSAAIRTQIKDIQENQLQEEAVTETTKSEQDAIQKQTAGQVPVLTEAGVSQEVPGGLTQTESEIVAQEGVQEEVGQFIIEPTERISWSKDGKEYKVGDVIDGNQLDELSGNLVGNVPNEKFVLVQEPLSKFDDNRESILSQEKGYEQEEIGRLESMKANFDQTPPIPQEGDGMHRIVVAKELGNKTILMWKNIKDVTPEVSLETQVSPEISRESIRALTDEQITPAYDEIPLRLLPTVEGVSKQDAVFEAYFKSKQKNTNPELVQAVERLINQVSSKTQPNVNLRITELEKEKSKLTSKALKQFPQSPAQMKTRARIDEINAELKTLKAEPEAVSSKTQEVAPVVEQYVPIVPKQITNEKFTRDNSIDYEEGERETDSGRTVTYLASLTVEAQDENGDTVGSLTKITDEDGIVSWNAADVDGNELSFDGFDSKDEAKQALVDKVNKERKKEFDKEAKKKVKAKEKKKFDEIYNKYDKLINPLLKSAKQLGEDIALVEASSGGVDNPALKDVGSTAKALEGKDVNTILDSQRNKSGDEITYLPNVAIINKIKGAKVGDEITLDIPVDKYLYGHDSEIFPSIQHDNGFSPKSKREIKEPIRINIESVENPFTESTDGNHRIIQARFNKDKTIPAKLEITEEIKKQADNFNYPKSISKAYHKAKLDGSNPELVKAVEQLITQTQENGQQEAGTTAGPIAGNRLFNKPLTKVKEIANRYYQRVFGTERPKFAGTRNLDEARAKRISDAYIAMKNNPTNPKVKAAYEALSKETIEQYKDFLDAGFTVEINNEEAYANSQEMIEDLRSNNRIKIFSTEAGYGDTPITDEQRKQNPLLRDSGFKDINGKTLLVNDVFRAIHDFYGHAELGNSFGAKGEENAWNLHARMFSPLARKAMTTETRGQNSYVNFSGVNEKIEQLREEARRLREQGDEAGAQVIVDKIYQEGSFADQKIGLLPEEFFEFDEQDMGDVSMRPEGLQERDMTQTQVGEFEAKAAEIDALLDLDMDDEDNMLSVLNALDRVDTAITKRLRGGANEALLALPLSTVQLVVKTLKALVKGGMILRDAIRKVATDNNISQDTIKDIINIAPIQDGFNALMDKVGAMIKRQTSRGTEAKKIISNIDTFVRNSELYQNANDAQKKILEREARTQSGARERRAPSIGRILGVLKDITNVSRKDKLSIISRIRQLSKDAAKDLANEIRELNKSGRITLNQAANIVARFGKVNMLSEISVSKFVDYMTKVFNDAEYNSKLSSAKSTKRDIAKLSKNKDKDANLRDLGKEFVKIDPSMVENIDEYNDMASKIKEAIKGSTIRGQKVSFASTVNIDNATDYIKTTMEAQDKMMRAEKAAEIQSLMGIDVSDFSYDDMMLLLDSDKPITKYNEGIIRDTINKAFGIYSSIIKDAMRTGKDLFTGEDVKFTESQKDMVKRFMAMDLNVLSPKEALQAVDALANFLQNQSTARMEAVVSQYNGIVGAKELKAKGIKAFQLRKYGSTLLARFLGEQTTNLNVLFEKMFKGFTAGGTVMDKMGFTKLVNKKAAAQTEANRIVDRFVNLFYDKKANGEAFNSSYNNTERGMAAFMMRNVIGTQQEMKAEFDRRKGLIKESITELENGNDKEKAKAELYKKVYENILADSNTIEDVVKKVDKVNLEGVNFWLDEWNNKYDQLSEVAENVYNKKLDKDINYTPDRFFTLSSDTGTVEISNSESAFLVNSGTNDLYQRETGVLMEAVRPKSLPSGRYIDLSFDNNNANSMYDALVDINTAAPIRQIEAFLNSPDFKSVFPNSDDAKIIKGSKGRPGRIDMYIRNIRNKNPYSNDELASVVKKLNKIAAIGVGQALGGFTQPFKQVIPVMLNTIVNAGGLDLSASFNKAKNNFINNSGYSIANRGIESQAQIESLNKLVEEVSRAKGEKLINGIEKLNKWWLDTLLVKPDVFIARASWLTYYEKSLKKQGIDTKNLDYSTHKINEDAANYAQRMVDRQQNVSDSDLAGKFFASRESSTQLLVKTVMPFASFRMNQASRLGADLATLTNKTSSKEDKNIAARSLAGFGVEVATFRLVSIGISILLGSLSKAIMGIDEDDEEYEKRVDNIIKGARTGIFTDIFSPLPILDKPIQEIGAFITQQIEDATEVPVAIYSPKAGEYFQSAGLFGIAFERASQLAEIIKLSVTGEYTDDFGKKKTISSDAQDALKMLIVPALMTNLGLVPSEINTIVRYGIKDSKKATESSQEKKEKTERTEDREDNKQQKLDAFENIKDEISDAEVLDAIDEKIKELEATTEQKTEIEKKNKIERSLKKSLLVDPATGEEYDTETELKRYNKDLWEQNFGENSEWFREHEAEKEATKLLNQEIKRIEDEEYNYTAPKKKKRVRNSDGTFKRKSLEFGSAKFGGG